jgi:hypothetical protein
VARLEQQVRLELEQPELQVRPEQQVRLEQQV